MSEEEKNSPPMVHNETKQEEVEQGQDQIIVIGELYINLDKFEVKVRNKPIELTLREFEVLKYLASQPGQVVTREALLEKVWGYEYYGDIRTVDVTIRRIREKIEVDTSTPKLLITKRGVGYYLASKGGNKNSQQLIIANYFFQKLIKMVIDLKLKLCFNIFKKVIKGLKI